MTTRRDFGLMSLAALGALAAGPRAWAMQTPGGTILFVGNSFTYGASSPVWRYNNDTVTDLNEGGVGGVPALFKAFTVQAGLAYDVSLETVGGQGLDHHLTEKRALIDATWDTVVMHGYSTMDRENPGNPALLIATAGEAAALFVARNPDVEVHLTATWGRPDLTFREDQPWSGQTPADMAADIRAGYDAAAEASPHIDSVIPVGEAFARAVAAGVADANPYDGISFDQVPLWTYDHYHGSTFGYYLEALMVFGRVTGLDPLSLGPRETAARELGMSGDQTTALQQVAYDELAAYAGKGA
jgi:hypothetical protein